MPSVPEFLVFVVLIVFAYGLAKAFTTQRPR
jgi:hypothetical protein